MLQHIFPFESEASELQKDSNSSSHCSSVEEKLERYGSHALNESEHLWLIIGSETAGSTLIQHFGSISALSRASLQQLRAFLPRTKAIRLMVALQVSAVALRQDSISDPLDSPEKIAALCSEMRYLSHESLRIVLVNAKYRLIKVCSVSEGTLNESLAHPREIFKQAIVHSAYAFVLVHNHPSGDPNPSEADMRLTRRISEAARILQIQFLDHVIIGQPINDLQGYFSFKEAGITG